MTTRSGTWGRASNMQRVRTCPICKQQMEQGARYRWDTRTHILWHIECEASPKFAALQERIAAAPTVTPTFPTAAKSRQEPTQ